MDRKNQLARNTLILSIGRFSTQLISFFLLPIYTLYLSAGAYGLVDLILTYVGLLAPILTLQIEMATFRFLIDSRKNELRKKEIITNVLEATSILIISIMMLYLFLGHFIHIKYFSLIALVLGSIILSNIFLHFARGLGDNKKYTLASIVNGLFTIIGAVLFVILAKKGAGGVLASIMLSNLACVFYLFWSLKIYKYIDLSKRSKAFKLEMLHYSAPLVPNGISWWVINVSDRTIVTIALGLAANGIYAVSNKYATIFSSIFAIFSLAWTESVSMHINAPDKNKFLSDTNTVSIKMFSSLGLVMIAFTPIVFKYYIGHNFQSASKYVPILIVAAFFNAIVGVYSAIYVAKKMTKKVMYTSIFAAVINISLTIGFIKFLGIYAAALATVVAFLVMAIYRHYDLKKYVHIKYERNLLAKICLAYTIIIVLFYTNNIFGNIISIFLAILFSLMLNWNLIKHFKNNIDKFFKIPNFSK
jgi:O-antigen/teichoic acid export membrane protein